VKRLLLA